MPGRYYAVLGPLHSGVESRGFLGCEVVEGLPQANRPVVVVWLPDELTADPRRLTKLLRETAFVTRLEHRHILTVHGLERFEEGWARITDFADGEPLVHILSRAATAGEPVTPEIAARIVLDLTEAVHHAHEEGAASFSGRPIVHGGIRPDTVLVGFDGTVVLGGYGAAVLAPATAHGFDRRAWAAYLAPEQIIGGKATASVATDVYALGAVLYTLLTGRRPFDDEPEIDAAIMGAPPPGAELEGRASALEEVVRLAMAKRGADRPSSAAELGERILQALSASGSEPASSLALGAFADRLVPPSDPARSDRETLLDLASDPEAVTLLSRIDQAPDGIEPELYEAARPGRFPSSRPGALRTASPRAKTVPAGQPPAPIPAASPSTSGGAIPSADMEDAVSTVITERVSDAERRVADAALELPTATPETLAALGDSFSGDGRTALDTSSGEARPPGSSSPEPGDPGWSSPVEPAQPQAGFSTAQPQAGFSTAQPQAGFSTAQPQAGAPLQPLQAGFSPAPPDAPLPQAAFGAALAGGRAVDGAPIQVGPGAPAPGVQSLPTRPALELGPLDPTRAGPPVQPISPGTRHASGHGTPYAAAAPLGRPGAFPAPMSPPGLGMGGMSATFGGSGPASRSFLAAAEAEAAAERARLQLLSNQPVHGLPRSAPQVEGSASESRITQFNRRLGDGSRSLLFFVVAAAFGLLMFVVLAPGEAPEGLTEPVEDTRLDRAFVQEVLAEADRSKKNDKDNGHLSSEAESEPPPGRPAAEGAPAAGAAPSAKGAMSDRPAGESTTGEGATETTGGTSPAREGFVSIKTDPPVDVFLDDVRLGRAPLRVPLPVGRQTLRLTDRVTGINTYRTVYVRGDRDARVHEVFETSELMVNAPAGSRIYLNGRLIAQAPMSAPKTIYEGRYLIKVAYEGMSWTERFEAAPGRRISFEVQLDTPSN